jgi:methyl-galactoside transport system ATP-binding protein
MVDFKNPVDALRHGVAMVHQELNQALSRTVMDNIWLGRYPTVGGVVSERRMLRDTEEIFASFGITVDPRRRMSTMSVSDRQMVEIAKAVSYRARILVFDEPTSSLNDREVEHLFRIIRMLRDQGCGIVYISHKMEEILAISDEVTVMRDGKWIATEAASALTVDEIIRLMVGRTLETRFPEKNNRPAEPILEVRGLCARHNLLRDVSFTLRRGEIFGVAGLAGAGRSELLEAIYGLSERKSGELFKDGKPILNRTPREAIGNGFALLTEERRATGIFGVLSIRENATVTNLRRYRIGGLMLSDRRLRRATDWAIRSMRIKTPHQRTQIRTLSGGNQQKVILSRWLLTSPQILLLDEPTRGIDVGAKYEIYVLLKELAAAGKSILIASSELPELMGVCHRIYVMSGGEITGVVNAASTTQEEIMTLAAKNV